MECTKTKNGMEVMEHGEETENKPGLQNRVKKIGQQPQKIKKEIK